MDSEHGSAMVLVLTMIIILSLIGVWNLTSSTTSMRIAGHYSKSAQVEQRAETAIRLAAQRLREIAVDSLTDSLYSRGVYSGTEHSLTWLLESIQPESSCASEDLVCPTTFDPEQEFDSINCSLICNFMGSVVEEQVILSRKEDLIKGASKSAVFLLSSVSKDAVGRRKVRYGVMTIPYAGSLGSWEIPAGQQPSLATAVNSNF